MINLSEITIHTNAQTNWFNITNQVQKAVNDSGISEGICVVFVPHTTAGITINENADPDVPRDVNLSLNMISPDRQEFRHSEGNSAAHTKSSLFGASLTIIITGGRLLLGTWQSVWFTEFDGPRKRKVHIRVMGE